MNYTKIGNRTVSKVGIGGHYSKMEEGKFEDRYAQVTKEEISRRTKWMEKAFDAGITYYDTTWRNEVDMLSESIRTLGIRDQIHINGMVLGTFAGSVATGLTPCQYVDQWLDDRLRSLPGNHFDSFMINAIEENYSEEECAVVLEHLEKRRQKGDFDLIGFSCHDHALARKIADTFPQFELIMLAYNYKNRKFEETFAGYEGNASFVSMKPLIWYEYGIPFCCINNLPAIESVLGAKADEEIATKSVEWNLKNPMISTCVCGINSEAELDSLIKAGSETLSDQGEQMLERYRLAIESADRIPFFISSILGNIQNRRSYQFGLQSLSKALSIPYPDIPLNQENTDEELVSFQQMLLKELKARGLDCYLSEK